MPDLKRRRASLGVTIRIDHQLCRAVGVSAFCLIVVTTALCASSLAGSTTRLGEVPRLDHVVVIVFENRERSSILGPTSSPTFDRLALRYAQATDDHAVAHPSLPNYLALVSGSTHGVTNDCVNCPQNGKTIGTLLSDRGRTWSGYAEGFPVGPDFAKKHVPFLYFAGDESHVRPLTAFDPARLPDFAFVTPDLCHDMHDCSIGIGDAWLARFISPLLAIKRTAIFITFDEGTTDVGGGGQVALIVAGTAVRPHSLYLRRTSHYGVLRTIEDALGLPALGDSRRAAPLTGIWR
jgi:phosphatidylinositol-3-phosphatase